MVHRHPGTIAPGGVVAYALGVDRSNDPEPFAASVRMGAGSEAPRGFRPMDLGRQSPDRRRFR